MSPFRDGEGVVCIGRASHTVAGKPTQSAAGGRGEHRLGIRDSVRGLSLCAATLSGSAKSALLGAFRSHPAEMAEQDARTLQARRNRTLAHSAGMTEQDVPAPHASRNRKRFMIFCAGLRGEPKRNVARTHRYFRTVSKRTSGRRSARFATRAVPTRLASMRAAGRAANQLPKEVATSSRRVHRHPRPSPSPTRPPARRRETSRAAAARLPAPGTLPACVSHASACRVGRVALAVCRCCWQTTATRSRRRESGVGRTWRR